MHSLEHLTTEQINAELQKRKTDAIAGIKRQIAEHRQAIADLESELGDKPKRAAKILRTRVDIADASEKVLSVISSQGTPVGFAVIGGGTDLPTHAVKSALDALVASGKIIRTGKTRGMVYTLA